ncbi:hypothetical protein TVAG_254460 [Trichomonas vaginalis G3]|uniref:Uncharacterized protein n=1 Tax=Trichomonas vaginalis (strain ATCC PRA-98 / G3) TaxID=412133 RepID=A2DMW3_TRIV3|nr:hypothetical protein TVAGG3_0058680 [Trichomonas vaginalis G3]EAY18334.1 hypothetical protein TVAG_254460 [Trichomonas vaginalis G3]KAI5541835.1 hypothetical protein TVAGG3_0058680 [Trichomonas vaginalis G3]|eukprot:XP_001579320.1 hypothetical protein [Trichomonas vaginalis G3]
MSASSHIDPHGLDPNEVINSCINDTDKYLRELLKIRFEVECSVTIGEDFYEEATIHLSSQFLCIKIPGEHPSIINLFLPLYNMGFREVEDETSGKYILSISQKYKSESLNFPLIEIVFRDGEYLARFAKTVKFCDEIYKHFYTSTYEVNKVQFILDNVNCVAKLQVTLDSIQCIDKNKVLLKIPRDDKMESILMQNYPSDHSLQSLQHENSKLFFQIRNSVAILDFFSIEKFEENLIPQKTFLQVKKFLLYMFSPIKKSEGIISDVFEFDVPEIQSALASYDLEKLLDGDYVAETPDNKHQTTKQFFQTDVSTDAENFMSQMQEKIEYYKEEMKKEELRQQSKYEIENELSTIMAKITADCENKFPYQTNESDIKRDTISLEMYESLSNRLYEILSDAKPGQVRELKVKFGLATNVTYDMFMENLRKYIAENTPKLRGDLKVKIREERMKELIANSGMGTQIHQYGEPDEFVLIITPCYPVLDIRVFKDTDPEFELESTVINSPFIATDIPDKYYKPVNLKYIHEIQKQYLPEEGEELKVVQVQGHDYKINVPNSNAYKNAITVIANVQPNTKSIIAASALLNNLTGSHEGKGVNYVKFGKQLKKLKFKVRDIETVIKLYPIVDIPSTIVFFNHLLERDACSTFFNSLETMYDFKQNNYESDSIMLVPNACTKIAKQLEGAITTLADPASELLFDDVESPIVRITNNVSKFLLYETNDKKSINQEPKVTPSFALEFEGDIELSIQYLSLVFADFVRIISYPLDYNDLNLMQNMWDFIKLVTPKMYDLTTEFCSYFDVIKYQGTDTYKLVRFLVCGIIFDDLQTWCIKFSERTDTIGQHSLDMILVLNQLQRISNVLKSKNPNLEGFCRQIESVMASVLP